MPVIISDSLVVGAVQEFDDDNPIIGYETLITSGGCSSGTLADEATEAADADFPAANVANPATNLVWKANGADQDYFLQFDLDGLNPIDYIAFAAHNLGSTRRSLKIYGATGVDGDGDPVFFNITQDFMLSNDSPVLVRFDEADYVALRILMVDTQSGAADPPEVGVVYAGKLLVVERKIQVAFTPITMGRRTEVLSGRSESGRFLGRVITSSWRECSANIAFMSPDWYREFMDPFLDAAQTEPFFFAWAPESYPNEIGYAWLAGDAIPTITHSVNFMAITLQMQGIS